MNYMRILATDKDPRIEIIQALTNHNDLSTVELKHLIFTLNELINGLDLDSLDDTEQEYQDYLSKLFKENPNENPKELILTAIVSGNDGYRLPMIYDEIEEYCDIHPDYPIYIKQPNIVEAILVTFVGKENNLYYIKTEFSDYVCENKDEYPFYSIAA